MAMWSCWCHQMGIFSSHWSSSQLTEVAGLTIRTSKSETMVFSWRRADCPLGGGSETLPQVEGFKYPGVLFMREGGMERKIERPTGVIATTGPSVVKEELRRKVRLLVYWSSDVPTLTYGHELWVVTERARL